MSLDEALEKVGRILEGCDAKNQPSEALLKTFMKLLDRKLAPDEAQVTAFLGKLKEIDDRLRRLEAGSTAGALRGARTPGARARAQSLLPRMADAALGEDD